MQTKQKPKGRVIIMPVRFPKSQPESTDLQVLKNIAKSVAEVMQSAIRLIESMEEDGM